MSDDKLGDSELARLPETVASDASRKHLALALVLLTHAQTYLENDEKLPGPVSKARGLIDEAVQAIEELL